MPVGFDSIRAGAAGAAGGGYEIDYSCRFNDNDNAYLQKTFGSPTDATRWTFSCWIKRCNFGTEQYFFSVAAGGNYIRWNPDNTIRFRGYPNFDIALTRMFRDPSAWYHLVATLDDGAVTLYINNTSVGSASVSDSTYNFFTAIAHSLSADVGGGSPSDHYMAECIGIDGTAYNPSDFAETNADTGEWVPIDPSGLTFGNNGFWLDFADASSLGNDVSGNNNDWTSSGLATNDQVTDTPTNNYCVMSSVDKDSGITLSDGGLKVVRGSSIYKGVKGTFIVPKTGKWKWEIKILDTTYPLQCLAPASARVSNLGYGDTGTFAFLASNAAARYSNVEKATGTGTSVNDIVEWRVNEGAVEVFVNNVSFHSFTETLGDIDENYFPGEWQDSAASGVLYNFGQSAFVYEPAGFLALNTKNLADPTIVDPSAHFQATLYTGNATAGRAITQDGNSTFGADMVWIKNRDQADEWKALDTTRGATKELNLDSSNAESTDSNGLTAFSGSDGFTLGTGAGGYNDNGEDFVAYQWEKGATPGFDIVSFTAPSGTTAFSTAHNLGVTPNLDYIVLNTNAAQLNLPAGTWGGANTSSVFYNRTGNSVTSSESYITYLFAAVEGFSAFGSYVGNGSVDGPMINLGFKPALLITKKTSGLGSWQSHTVETLPANIAAPNQLYVGRTDAEVTTSSQAKDLLSNGFKIRTTDGGLNTSGGSYIYMAWAENPFKTATAR